MILALFIGTALGFISAIPVAGPVSALVFSRGVEGRYSQGRWIAVGAGLVEGGYAFFAVWGFNHFLRKFNSLFFISNAAAMLMLAALGIYFFKSTKMRSPPDLHSPLPIHPKKALLVGASVSSVNLSVIATWALAITTLSSFGLFQFSMTNAIFFPLGVSIGIILWFHLMIALMAKHRNRIDQTILDKGLKAVGLALFALSVAMACKIHML